MSDKSGTRIVSHGGSSIGVHCEFFFVPERDFAVAMLANSDRGGPALLRKLEIWVLETYLGLAEEDPLPVTLSDADLARYVGTYQTLVGTLHITAEAGELVLRIELNPETIDQLVKAGEEPPIMRPFRLGILQGPGDKFTVVSDQQRGMKGFFPRSQSGEIEGIHFGGRLAGRV
jgi:hypothetical protein